MFHRAAQAYNWLYNKTVVGFAVGHPHHPHHHHDQPTNTGALRRLSSPGMGVRFMSPSCIHFMCSGDGNILCSQFDVPALSERILADGDFPKVQAVHKDGYWFTLNNLQLEVCRKLESDGRCSTVQVNIVSLSDVPDQLRKMMVVPNTKHQGEIALVNFLSILFNTPVIWRLVRIWSQ